MESDLMEEVPVRSDLKCSPCVAGRIYLGGSLWSLTSSRAKTEVMDGWGQMGGNTHRYRGSLKGNLLHWTHRHTETQTDRLSLFILSLSVSRYFVGWSFYVNKTRHRLVWFLMYKDCMCICSDWSSLPGRVTVNQWLSPVRWLGDWGQLWGRWGEIFFSTSHPFLLWGFGTILVYYLKGPYPHFMWLW